MDRVIKKPFPFTHDAACASVFGHMFSNNADVRAYYEYTRYMRGSSFVDGAIRGEPMPHPPGVAYYDVTRVYAAFNHLAGEPLELTTTGSTVLTNVDVFYADDGCLRSRPRLVLQNDDGFFVAFDLLGCIAHADDDERTSLLYHGYEGYCSAFPFRVSSVVDLMRRIAQQLCRDVAAAYWADALAHALRSGDLVAEMSTQEGGAYLTINTHVLSIDAAPLLIFIGAGTATLSVDQATAVLRAHFDGCAARHGAATAAWEDARQPLIERKAALRKLRTIFQAMPHDDRFERDALAEINRLTRLIKRGEAASAKARAAIEDAEAETVVAEELATALCRRLTVVPTIAKKKRHHKNKK